MATGSATESRAGAWLAGEGLLLARNHKRRVAGCRWQLASASSIAFVIVKTAACNRCSPLPETQRTRMRNFAASSHSGSIVALKRRSSLAPSL